MVNSSHNWTLIQLIIPFLLFGTTIQISTPESKTYWAAVVEFSSEPHNQTTADRLETALSAYVELIESAETLQADIIVFPEATFNNIQTAITLPDPSANISPCDSNDWDPALKQLSCSAKRSQKYVVINLTEQKNVTDETDNTHTVLRYNANVVFDRAGRVISRYRKFNLFGEPGTSVTETADISFFTTDFNVTFGHFICFDLLFKEPALKLMENEQITDIAYPTMWFSELPFLSAVQAQNMWATKQRVNFLAAGASNPSVGSTGSGIYSKDGPMLAIMSGTPQRKVYLAEVPKKQFWAEMTTEVRTEIDTQSEEILVKRDNLEVYSAKLLNLPVGTSENSENLCYEELCCDFEVKATKRAATNEAAYFYRHFLVAFDGVRSYDGFATGGTFACAVISCLNETLASCGLRFDADKTVERDVVFEQIRISGAFRSTDDTLALPNTVNDQLMPLPQTIYYFKEEAIEGNSSRKMISISLTQSTSDLYTFGIYGRDFAKDGMEPSGANLVLINGMFVLMLSVLLLKYVW